MITKKQISYSTVVSTMLAVTFAIVISGCASQPQKDKSDQLVQATGVDVALNKFYKEATNARQIVEGAQGVLVCPTITKAGFVFGGEGGTCSMQINGITTGYYRASAFKAGLLAGAESYSLLVVFNDADALAKFRDGTRNWQVGGNLSVAVAKKGASGGFDSRTSGAAITAYVYSQKGLMGDVSIDGSVFKKLEK